MAIHERTRFQTPLTATTKQNRVCCASRPLVCVCVCIYVRAALDPKLAFNVNKEGPPHYSVCIHDIRIDSYCNVSRYWCAAQTENPSVRRLAPLFILPTTTRVVLGGHPTSSFIHRIFRLLATLRFPPASRSPSIHSLHLKY